MPKGMVFPCGMAPHQSYQQPGKCEVIIRFIPQVDTTGSLAPPSNCASKYPASQSNNVLCVGTRKGNFVDIF